MRTFLLIAMENVRHFLYLALEKELFHYLKCGALIVSFHLMFTVRIFAFTIEAAPSGE